MMIAAGYEDGNDASSLRIDPVFKMALGQPAYRSATPRLGKCLGHIHQPLGRIIQVFSARFKKPQTHARTVR